ncbi:MAG: HAMP domain-containing histidine kinase, partial [Alphaproteobacteria bacterium]|nr:HAMP domain-containing histidine kinase [Alphaproteobacteria bacterium]
GLDAEYLAGEPHVSDLAERCRDLYVFDEEWDVFKQKLITPVLGHQQKSGHLETRDGKTITWRSIPLPDGAILTTYLDITDSTLVERSLREKNEALQEADRLKSEFLANVSYELRSPLTSIIGFSEVLAQNYFGELAPRQREYVDGIHASSTQLMEIINDILDLASIEAGYLKLDISRFDLHDMLTAMAALVRERMKEQELTLEVRADESLGNLSGDEKRLRQIIFNLLSNAIKFTPPGGKIILGAQNAEAGEVMFYVQDTGVGIGEEELARAFDRFYKSGSHRRHKSGAGLGLSIVKNFVELHGGRIELDSERGKGTTVRFYLPREARVPEPADMVTPHVAA